MHRQKGLVAQFLCEGQNFLNPVSLISGSSDYQCFREVVFRIYAKNPLFFNKLCKNSCPFEAIIILLRLFLYK